MSNKEIFKKCMEMKVDTFQDFVLDHDAKPGEMSALSVKLSNARGVGYSINRQGRNISVHCYIPNVPV